MKQILPLAFWAFASQAFAVTVSSPTTQWVAIQYPNPSLADPADDLQTGSYEGDIVGNATHASLYMGFNNGGTPLNLTDGEIAFRLRVAGDDNPSGFGSVFWVGIDVNLDGKVDIFTGGSAGNVGIYKAGSLANTSPSTTSIDTSKSNIPYEVAASATNFDFSAVDSISDPSATSFNLDGGSSGGANHTDQFVSFMLPFSQLVAAINALALPNMAPFDQNSPMRYVAATSKQMNSLNQDLNGVNDGINSTTTWVDLGGLTPVVNSSGAPVTVPEPATAGLAAAGLIALATRRSRKQR